MKPVAFYILPAILFVALIACSNTDDPIIDEDLLGVVWKGDTLKTPDELLAGVTIGALTIEFTRSMEVVGETPLSRSRGSYEIGGGGNLQIGIIDTVEKTYRTPYPYEILYLFIDALENIEKFDVEDSSLTLSSISGDYRIDLSVMIVDINLFDSVWILDSLRTTNEWLVPEKGEEITMQFYRNLEVTGDAHCNWYGGLYELGQDNSLTIGCIGRTEVYCPLLHKEDIYLDALLNVTFYELKKNLLTLYDSDQPYVFYFHGE